LSVCGLGLSDIAVNRVIDVVGSDRRPKSDEGVASGWSKTGDSQAIVGAAAKDIRKRNELPRRYGYRGLGRKLIGTRPVLRMAP